MIVRIDSRHCQIVNIVKKPRTEDQIDKIYLKTSYVSVYSKAIYEDFLRTYFPITLIIAIELSKS